MRKKTIVALLLAFIMMLVAPLEALAETANANENAKAEQTQVEQKAELEGTVVQSADKKVALEKVGNVYKLSWAGAKVLGTSETAELKANTTYNVYKNAETTPLNTSPLTDTTFDIPNTIEGAQKFVVKSVIGKEEVVGSVDAYLGYLAVDGDNTTKATISWKGTGGDLYIDGKKVNSGECTTPGTHTAQVKKTEGQVEYKSEEVSFKVSGPAPADVTGLVAYASCGAVDLDWADVAGATSYKVYVSDGRVIDTGANSCASVSVAQDVGYTFSVKAVANEVESVNAAVTTGAAVRTMYYNITFKASAKLTSHSGGKVTVTFPKGFKTQAFEFYRGMYHFKYNDRVYYAKAIRTKSQSIAGWSGGWAYSEAEAERYVNARGVGSSTGYLIWTNLYTQYTYIFKGSARNWHIVKAFPCSTGAARTPTDTGVTKIKKKLKTRHSLPYWNMCAKFSLHGKQKRWPIGKGPKSGGCVRNYNENAYWIYVNCPKGTTVCVF